MNATEYRSRIARTQEKMRRMEISRMFIGPGSNLYYLTGIKALVSERIYLLAIPSEGRSSLILPSFERLSAEDSGVEADIVEWYDSDGPTAAVNYALSGVDAKSVAAIDDQLWSGFLIDLQSSSSIGKWTKASAIMRELRAQKSSEEINLLKQAAAIADKAFADLVQLQFAGRKENEIATEIDRLLRKHGQEEVQFKIVGSGPNGAKPHHDASDRVIQAGDAVVLDFGGTYHGYQSDMTRMVLVGGAPDEEYARVHAIVNEANLAARAASKPGVTAESVDAAARAVIEKAGYGQYFTHRTGHGIGIDVHEHPFIVAGNKEELREGMAFSIEPGIYLPGRFGVRIEDIVVVTSDGAENINLTPHEVVFVR